MRLTKKNISLLLLVAKVWQGEDIPHPIPDHILKKLILLGFDKDWWISFPRNAIQLDRAYIIGACLICLPILLEGMWVEFTNMDRS